MNTKRILSKIDYSKIIERPEELPLYQEVARNIIEYLRNNKRVTFQEVVKWVGGSDRRTLRLLDQMVACSMLEFSSPFFTLKGAREECPIKISDVRCRCCDSKAVSISSKMERVARFMEKAFQTKPMPTFVFDQRPVTAETTTRRVAYVIWRGDLQRKRLVIVGDDDLTSLAIGMTKMAREIIVLDIDERVLKYIDTIAKRNGLAIKTVKCDLTKKIPVDLRGRFDVFMTDPTPTPKPFTLFVNAGIKLLKPGGNKVGYVSLYPSCKLGDIELQRVMTEMKMIVTDIIPFFTEYDFIRHTYSKSDLRLLKKYAAPEPRISFYESLARLETTSETRPLKINFSSPEIIGTATERVLKDPKKDPVLGCQKSLYVKRAALRLKKELKGQNG